jgi:hypothetical protein
MPQTDNNYCHVPVQSPCPTCGRCPTCGHEAAPRFYWIQYPWGWTQTSSDRSYKVEHVVRPENMVWC